MGQNSPHDPQRATLSDHDPCACQSAGSIADGGSTHRENNTTVTDQALFVSVGSDSLDELHGYWDALSIDAVIVEPLAASAWSAGFGMLTDLFGVTWSVSVIPANTAE